NLFENFVAQGATGCGTTDVSGFVRDASGAAISGATVVAVDQQGVTRASAATNVDGAFTLTVGSGRLRYRASKTGFQTQWYQAELDFDSADAVDASQFDGGPSFTLARLVTVNGLARCGSGRLPPLAPGATVKLYTGTTFVAQTTADATTAAFSFSGLGPGEYTLTYLTAGASCGGAKLTVNADGSYDIAQTAGSIISLDNYNWMTAYGLTLADDPAPAKTKSTSIQEHIDRLGRAAWFKVHLPAGSSVL